MNSRLTRILIVVFAGLVVAVLLLTAARRAAVPPVLLTPRTQAPPPYLFPSVEATQITKITLDDPQGKHRITLTRVPGGWTGIDENTKSVDVDLAQITRMIQTLASLRYNRVLEGSDLSAYGLSNGGVFTVRFEAGSSYTLHVGQLTSSGTDAFVQVNDDAHIYLASFKEVASLVAMVAKLDAPTEVSPLATGSATQPAGTSPAS